MGLVYRKKSGNVTVSLDFFFHFSPINPYKYRQRQRGLFCLRKTPFRMTGDDEEKKSIRGRELIFGL